MIFLNISVRDVDPKVFREFKVKTVLDGTKTGVALTLAMKEWAEKKEKKKEGKTKNIFNLQAWDWGKGSENESENVDKVIYGGKI